MNIDIPERWVPVIVIAILLVPVLLTWGGCFDALHPTCPYGEWPVQAYGGTVCVPR